VTAQGAQQVDLQTRGGDFYMATTGDLNLATSGDFYMATDNFAAGNETVKSPPHTRPQEPLKSVGGLQTARVWTRS
jgi:hypothetical protein